MSAFPLATSDYRISELYGRVRTPRWTLSLRVTSDGRVYLNAGCRSFFSTAVALNHWENHTFRPEFVLAIHALVEAAYAGEVTVDGRRVEVDRHREFVLR